MTTLARGVLVGGGADEVLFRSWICLLIYAVMGLAAGQLANWIIDEAVRSRVAEELAAVEAARKQAADTKRTG